MKKAKGRKRQKGLSGIGGMKAVMTEKRKHIGFAVLSFLGGAVVANALNRTPAGKFSGLAGMAAMGFGGWKENLYASSFGAGMFFTNVGFPKSSDGTNGIYDEEMDGFDIKAIGENAKSYFQSLGQKLMPLSKDQSTNGLNGDDDVQYFLNPSSEVDLSALNSIEEQMDQGRDLDNEEMNF